MKIKYDIEVKDENVKKRIVKIINQIYKLLPVREEEDDWEKPLSTIFEELKGMESLLDFNDEFFGLLCKLEGLYSLKDDKYFQEYRRNIFECLSILNSIKGKI